MASRSFRIYSVSLAVIGSVLIMHCLIFLLAPFKSQYSLLPAVSVLVLFFIVFFLSAGIVLFLWARKRPAGMASDFVLDRVFQARGLWILLVVLSSTGTVLHVLAKYYLTNLYRSEEHTSELQSLMRISYAVFCLKKKKY